MAKTASNKDSGVALDKKALEELEKAKKKFAEANKAFQEQRTAVSKAKRTIATGEKKIQTLEKKIEEAKEAPTKAVETLLKKAADMEEKAKALKTEEKETLAKAAAIDKQVEDKSKELESAQEESKKQLEELGVSPAATRRSTSTGTTAERRAKNNFQYRLKSKGWELSYNVKGRIESATKYGLLVDFGDDDFTITKDGAEVLKHPYGEGSLISLASTVKEHGVGVEED